MASRITAQDAPRRFEAAVAVARRELGQVEGHWYEPWAQAPTGPFRTDLAHVQAIWLDAAGGPGGDHQRIVAAGAAEDLVARIEETYPQLGSPRYVERYDLKTGHRKSGVDFTPGEELTLPLTDRAYAVYGNVVDTAKQAIDSAVDKARRSLTDNTGQIKSGLKRLAFWTAVAGIGGGIIYVIGEHHGSDRD